MVGIDTLSLCGELLCALSVIYTHKTRYALTLYEGSRVCAPVVFNDREKVVEQGEKVRNE